MTRSSATCRASRRDGRDSGSIGPGLMGPRSSTRRDDHQLAALGSGRPVHELDHVPRPARCWCSPTTVDLDPPTEGWAVGHRTGRTVHFMAKERCELAGRRLVARDAGVIFVEGGASDGGRSVRADHPGAGRGAGPLPEGRSQPRRAAGRGSRRAALLAMRTGVPIVSVGVEAPAHLPWARPIPRRSRVTIRIGPTFRLPVQPRASSHCAAAARTRSCAPSRPAAADSVGARASQGRSGRT